MALGSPGNSSSAPTSASCFSKSVSHVCIRARAPPARKNVTPGSVKKRGFLSAINSECMLLRRIVTTICELLSFVHSCLRVREYGSGVLWSESAFSERMRIDLGKGWYITSRVRAREYVRACTGKSSAASASNIGMYVHISIECVRNYLCVCRTMPVLI
jgi:hypothetical protein